MKRLFLLISFALPIVIQGKGLEKILPGFMDIFKFPNKTLVLSKENLSKNVLAKAIKELSKSEFRLDISKNEENDFLLIFSAQWVILPQFGSF